MLQQTSRYFVVLPLAAWLSLIITPGAAQDLSRFFKDTAGAFVFYDLKNDRYLRHNEERCRQRFSPFSTFKIPNSLIGLETKVLANAEQRLRWEPDKYPEASGWTEPPFVYWKQDQTLRFSADEQIEFLKRFYLGKLPVSARATTIVKDILVLEKTAGYTLSGKTGGGTLANGKALGWFAGYVETKGNVYFFAANIEGANYAAIRDRRVELTKQILAALGCLPQ
jgi:beta-lactamase class D